MKSLRFAISILTTIPVGHIENIDGKVWLKSVYFFPFCGYIIATLSLFPLIATAKIFYIPYIIQALIIVVSLFLFTGGLHLDGLADICDSFLCTTHRDRRVEIMRDSRIGAFGAIGLIFLITAKIAAVFILVSERDYFAVFAVIVLARFLMIVLIKFGRYFPYDTGMGQDIIGKISYTTLIITLIYTAPCFIFRKDIFITAIILLAMVLFLNKRSNDKVGGISGDVLGASCELSEVLGFMLLTVKPY
jgi:adenosylcobinamide-GDP ribazoletransferase